MQCSHAALIRALFYSFVDCRLVRVCKEILSVNQRSCRPRRFVPRYKPRQMSTGTSTRNDIAFPMASRSEVPSSFFCVEFRRVEKEKKKKWYGFAVPSSWWPMRQAKNHHSFHQFKSYSRNNPCTRQCIPTISTEQFSRVALHGNLTTLPHSKCKRCALPGPISSASPHPPACPSSP
jgi:hypothetical protein